MADQQQDIKKKGNYEQWTEEESKLLLELMVDAAAQGWRDNSGILGKQVVEERILPILNKKLGIQKTYKNYQSRLKWFKNKWSSYSILMRFSSGFGYDLTTKKFTACDKVWEEYFKAHPKDTELRYGTFEYYEDLEIAIGNGVAVGKNSIGLGSATDARTLGASEGKEVSIEDLEYDVDSNAFIRPNYNDTSFHSTSPLQSPEFLEKMIHLDIEEENLELLSQTQQQQRADANAWRLTIAEAMWNDRPHNNENGNQEDNNENEEEYDDNNNI
ncbi:hypothetical protein LguiB_017769 [Lonicera macranthoides]